MAGGEGHNTLRDQISFVDRERRLSNVVQARVQIKRQACSVVITIQEKMAALWHISERDALSIKRLPLSPWLPVKVMTLNQEHA